MLRRQVRKHLQIRFAQPRKARLLVLLIEERQERRLRRVPRIEKIRLNRLHCADEDDLAPRGLLARREIHLALTRGACTGNQQATQHDRSPHAPILPCGGGNYFATSFVYLTCRSFSAFCSRPPSPAPPMSR